MQLNELRQKHPKFIYQSYSLERQKKSIKIQYSFKIEPDIVFNPVVILPIETEIASGTMHNLAFHLGMIESLSYWKATCSPQLIVQAGDLLAEQRDWWKNLFINGLGEFYFKNNIDFSQSDFLTITNDYHGNLQSTIHKSLTAHGDLILVGGGKDSGVTIKLINTLSHRKEVLILNPIQSALAIAKQTGFRRPLVVKRTIDPKLLELNTKGYLNGHTPFSAYLAFLSMYIGVLYNYKYSIVSNERSASEGNIIFHGLEVNHQYSKSYNFEKSFRTYAKKYLSTSTEYFSFLRPLYDIQISHLFAEYTELHDIFHSCNVNQKLNTWCGKCPKCAFVFISLFPYLPYKETIKIFGNDFYSSPEIKKHIRDLVGIGKHKPFECVGTEEESKLAIALSIQKYRSTQTPVPPVLLRIEKELLLNQKDSIKLLEDKVNGKWNDQNFLPKEYAELLKEELKIFNKNTPNS